jgi:RNA recognition motif-containing protein
MQMKKLYVGNLPFSTTEDDLRDLFSQHGEVASASIVMDRETGRSRGFGFVEMANDADADGAINAVNGQEIGGRSLQVNEARPKTEGPRGFGGGGGGRGGFGGGGGGRGGFGGGGGGGGRGGDRGGGRGGDRGDRGGGW